MPNRARSAGRDEPLFDLRSFARPGPGGRVSLSALQLEQIGRTVSRSPEVIVKVSGGAGSAAGAIAHLRYIDRRGKLEIETDEGERLKGEGIEKKITDDWISRPHERRPGGPTAARPVASHRRSYTT